eukprot:TRINITY_DN21741_c0_g1_i1.p1 TRINITY_DN21741_c0_g1~~TRINITY_DN21741_c0_g1_i1.p1  ORF type:complete len:531 (+),score=77.71 TRINITY_DN21741_c0_g1_i1:88-1593(+)
MARNVGVQPTIGPPRTAPSGTLFAPGVAMHRAAAPVGGDAVPQMRPQRASSPKGAPMALSAAQRHAAEDAYGSVSAAASAAAQGQIALAATQHQQVVVQTAVQTRAGVQPQQGVGPVRSSSGGGPPPTNVGPVRSSSGGPPPSGVGPVRSSSGGQPQPLSPTRSGQPRGAGHPPPSAQMAQAAAASEAARHAGEAAESRGCAHPDCSVCLEHRKRGYVLVRLPCGHTARAQLVDVGPDLLAGWSGGAVVGARSDSPPLLTAMLRDRDHAGTSPPPRSIMRQVSGVRNPVPSVGIAAPLSGGSLAHQAAGLGPHGGLSSPSPQPTPGTMYRKATSSMTSLATTQLYPPGFAIPREGGSDSQPLGQITSRSSNGGCGGNPPGATPGAPTRGVSSAASEKARKSDGGLRPDGGMQDGGGICGGGGCGARRGYTADATTVAEVVTDSRGDVLHRLCNVILLCPQNVDKEQQLKVRGQVVGTYWDTRGRRRLSHRGRHGLPPQSLE